MNRTALLMLAACGGSSATPDAPSADAVESTGSVTVKVTERGIDVPGLPVFFRSLDGMTTFEAVTSMDGASGYNLTDGFVTVLLPRSRYGIDRLYTFVGVKMNDKLLLELEPRGPQMTEVTIDLLPDGNETGPFVIHSTCSMEDTVALSSTQPPTTLGVRCPAANADVLAVRIDPDTNAALSAQRKTFALDGTRNVTFDNYEAVANIPVQYSNTGAFTFAHTTQQIITSNGRLFTSFDGGVIGDPMDPVVITRPRVDGSTSLLVSTAYPRPDTYDEQSIYSWEPTPVAPPLTINVNLGQRLPAYVNTGTQSNPVIGTFNPTSRELVWNEGTGTETSELVRARVRFYRDDIPQGTAWTWNIVAPRGTSTAFPFPQLPVLMPLDLNPAAGDIAAIEELTNISLPAIPGFPVAYDAVRPNAFGDVNTLISPATGTMIVQRRFTHEPTDDGIPDPP